MREPVGCLLSTQTQSPSVGCLQEWERHSTVEGRVEADKRDRGLPAAWKGVLFNEND